MSLTSPPFFVFNTLIYHYRSFPTVLLSCIYLQPIKRSEFEAAHCRKVGTVGGDSPQGWNLRRHIAISKNKSSLSFIPDRFSILRISATYKKGGTVSGDSPQGRNLKRHIAALVAVFVGDEDYFYSVLVTLMSHYDIIVANPVGA